MSVDARMQSALFVLRRRRFVFSLVSLTPPPTTIPRLVCNKRPWHFYRRAAVTSGKKKAKIERRLSDYSLTSCPVPFRVWHGGRNKRHNWTSLARWCTRVWTGVNILIACSITYSYVFWVTRLFTGKCPSVLICQTARHKYRHHGLKVAPIKKLKKQTNSCCLHTVLRF